MRNRFRTIVAAVAAALRGDTRPDQHHADAHQIALLVSSGGGSIIRAIDRNSGGNR